MGVLIAAAAFAAGCGSDPAPETSTPTDPPAQALALDTDAFANGASIPARYTCDGDDISPELFWPPVADGRELALIADDTSADFAHWVLYDIPVSARELTEGSTPGSQGTAGLNDFGRRGYGGPCPPRADPPHRYVFTLYVLARPVDLPPGASADELRAAMAGAIVDQAEVEGFYGRAGR